nr:protein spinster homolog 1-like isoform X2 [Ciona intestinalis]XP_026693450.1 protein spinster homolog 1-like isoform X2 [Ciona intestinalis]XP_026693451.1 protein spinster homolog 1-like isoform X2 [Ciona intestinalis]|eukprot:XP_026693449.1 protein spinster homolog 1-like isoform X2 [Ciona intestinalis]
MNNAVEVEPKSSGGRWSLKTSSSCMEEASSLVPSSSDCEKTDQSEIAMVKTFQGAPLYHWYCTLILMLCYGFGELGHFLIGVTSREMAQDVHFGDVGCVTYDVMVETSAAVRCAEIKNSTWCGNITQNGTRYCEWNYTGQGIEYQVLAGPVFIAIFTVMGLVNGILGDRYNRIQILSVNVMFYSVMTLSSGFADVYWLLALLRFGFGAGESACTPLTSSIVVDLFEPRVRGSAMSFFNWGIYFGYGLAFAIGNYLTDANILGMSWRWCYFFAGGPGMIMAVVLYATVREPQRRLNETEIEKRAGEISIGKRIWETIKIFATSPVILMLLVGACFRHSASFCWSYNSQLYFDQYYPGTEVGLAMSLTSIIGGTVGIVTGGILSDVLASRYGVRARLWVLVASQTIAAPLAAGTLFFPPPYAFICLLCAYLFAEMWFGVLFTVLVEFFPSKSRATAISMFIFIINNVGGNAPLIVPPIIDQIGFREALYIVYPGFYLAGAVFFLITQLLLLRHKFPQSSQTTSDENITDPDSEIFGSKRSKL